MDKENLLEQIELIGEEDLVSVRESLMMISMNIDKLIKLKYDIQSGIEIEENILKQTYDDSITKFAEIVVSIVSDL
ncbi:hypothetical protein QTH49_13270 [Clostridium perfringens]|nr:hypothetical protein [Clostridium perfringens]MDM0528425.1 hypothetical protein [Clostridium perfringens]